MRTYLSLLILVILTGFIPTQSRALAQIKVQPPPHVPTQDELLDAVRFLAISGCDGETLKWFMGNHPDFDVNHRDPYSKLTLLEAAITQAKCQAFEDDFYRAVMQLPLLDINMPTTGKITPLDLAILDGKRTAAKFLLARIDSVFSNAVIPYPVLYESVWTSGRFYCTGCTVLEFAAATIFKDTLDPLLKSKKPDVNAGSEGSTPLIAAAGFGNLDAVTLLLASNADVNTRNKQGYTALRAAKVSGRESDFCPVKFQETDSNILGDLIHGTGPQVSEDTRKQIINLLLAHGAIE